MAEEKTIEEKGLAIYTKIAGGLNLDPETIAIIHNSVAKGTSVSELAYFLNVAKAAGLNPFMKEVWCYKSGSDLLVFAGRDGFLKKAQQSPDYKGIQSAAVFEEDVFKLITDTSNNDFDDSIKVYHEIQPKKGGRGALLGAWCVAYREDKAPYGVWCELSRYDKKRNVWTAFPEDMIIKVAEAKALKKCFGVAGLQIEEDFNIQDGVVVNEFTPKPVAADKSTERLEAMIENAKDIVSLEKLKDYCTTSALMLLYDNKLKSFT